MQIAEPLSEAGAPESNIQQLEIELGHCLPEDYRRFLVETNGGRPERSRFAIQTLDGSTDSVVDWFLTLDTREQLYTIKKYREMYADRIPDGVVPIGCDPLGNRNRSPASMGSTYLLEVESCRRGVRSGSCQTRAEVEWGLRC
jgi:SMI1-KNR4 cell-wall